MRPKKISYVIPVMNEEDNLARLAQELTAVMEELSQESEVLLIDDGSRDRSRELIREICEKDERFKAVFFKRNFGQTSAMRAGFYYASGDVIIPMDGDLQNDPADTPKFLEKIEEGFDVVSGWRKNRQDRALKRKLPSMIANKIISWMGKVPLHDYGCSMKAYRADYVKDIQLYGEMHRFLPIYARWQGAKITEIIVNHRAREAGVSKYGLNRTFKVLLDMMVVRFLEKYFQKPIYLFGSFGFASFGASALVFFAMLFFKFFGGKSFIETPLPIVAVSFFLLGFVGIGMGLLAEIMVRTYFESQNRLPFDVLEEVNLEKPALESTSR